MLVELMVTVGIPGILAGIALPTMSTYVARAQCAAMKVALNFIMDGEDMYFTENNSFTEAGTTAIATSMSGPTWIPIITAPRMFFSC